MGNPILEGIAIFWLIFSIFFTAVGVASVIRLPDAYSRLNASSKVSTMGVLGLILGVGFLLPSEIFKLIFLLLAVAIAAPVNSHAIAKADKEYTERQMRERDSSISEAGAQEAIQSTQEVQQINPTP